MTKILIVCSVPTERSGIPNMIFNLLERLGGTIKDIGYVSVNKPSSFYVDKLRKINAKLFIIPRKLLNPFGYVYALAKVARNYDIIHVHGNSATMLLEMIAAKIAGVKIRIAHAHSTSCNMKIIDKLARSWFYRLCNGRLACGQEAGEWLFRNNKFFVINNGIDVDKFRFNRNTRKLVRERFGMKDEYVIGHIGNFVPVKNHIFLIDLFHKITELQPKFKLLLLGDGPLNESLRNKVTDSGLVNQVIFAGSVDHPEEYLNAMDIIIMPSLYEGMPLTLIEEQANGLSIVASDTITSDANITGSIRYIPLSSHIEQWVEAVEEILKTNSHNELTSSMAISKIREAKFDLDSSAKTLLDYYNCRKNES